MLNHTKIIFNSVIVSLLISKSLIAGEVIMFPDQPPTAVEMGNILFSKQSVADEPAIKLRSIGFSKPVTEQADLSAVPVSDTVGLPIKFRFNSDKILSESMPFLDEVGKMLNLAEFSNEKLVIEGHTDAQGAKSYNYQLSQKRGDSVKNYLVSHFQISYDRLIVTGKGESEPLQGRNPLSSENRRVQFRKAL